MHGWARRGPAPLGTAGRARAAAGSITRRRHRGLPVPALRPECSGRRASHEALGGFLACYLAFKCAAHRAACRLGQRELLVPMRTALLAVVALLKAAETVASAAPHAVTAATPPVRNSLWHLSWPCLVNIKLHSRSTQAS